MIGVDLSAWNSPSDIKKAKQYGLDFVIVKAGSGLTYTDAKFNNIYQQCIKNNVHIGAYWYLYAQNIEQAKREADLFLQNVKNKKFDFPLWLDFEDKTQTKLSRILKTKIAITFMDRIERQKYYIGLYTMGSWFNTHFDYNYNYLNRTLKDFDTWVAHWTYSTKKTSKYVDRTTGMWQFSDKGSFVGIGKAGNGLDMNIAFKDYPNIIKKNKLNNY